MTHLKPKDKKEIENSLKEAASGLLFSMWLNYPSFRRRISSILRGRNSDYVETIEKICKKFGHNKRIFGKKLYHKKIYHLSHLTPFTGKHVVLNDYWIITETD